MKREIGQKLTDEQISALETAGFRRWTKYGKDRLYVNETVIGLEIETYKSSGMISYSCLNGEKISHKQAARILQSIDGGYVDVVTSKIYSRDGGYEYIRDAIEAI